MSYTFNLPHRAEKINRVKKIKLYIIYSRKEFHNIFYCNIYR